MAPAPEALATATGGWLHPGWPAPASVRALFTDRSGGVSQGCHAGLNLGAHVGDLPESVAANRERLAAAIGQRPVFLEQVHGTDVAVLDGDRPGPPALRAHAVADAAATSEPGAVCTIMVADCLPVLLTDRGGRAVGAAHAGWRGLLGQRGSGVIERTADAVARLAGCAASDLIAWLGPCIGPGEFEVGPDVRDAFVQADARAADRFVAVPGADGQWLADLPGLARQRLASLGIAAWGNDGGDGWCTVRQPSRFFSHRRDSRRLGGSGRMAACIWIVGAQLGGD
ncbi:MAG: peptidoglycan editing factor PgeF [Xylophilus ampelinus]